MARLICPESLYFTAWDTVGAAIAAATARVSIFLFILQFLLSPGRLPASDPIGRRAVGCSPVSSPRCIGSMLPGTRMFILVNISVRGGGGGVGG